MVKKLLLIALIITTLALLVINPVSAIFTVPAITTSDLTSACAAYGGTWDLQNDIEGGIYNTTAGGPGHYTPDPRYYGPVWNFDYSAKTVNDSRINYMVRFASCNNYPFAVPVYQQWDNSTSKVIFSVSETGNFSKKLSDVFIQIGTETAGTTNSSGILDTWLFPRSSYYLFSASKSGYFPVSGESLGGVGLYGGTMYFTLTPQPVTTTHTIEVTPISGVISVNFTGTISPIAGLKAMSWSWIDAGGVERSFYEAGSTSKTLNYANISGTWKGYNNDDYGYTNTKSSLPHPVTLQFSQTGTFTVKCQITTLDDQTDIPTDTVDVIGTTQVEIEIQPTDWQNGYLITGAAVNVKNLNTNIWSNGTAYNGRRSIFVPISSNLYVEASATGYQKSTIASRQATISEPWVIQMFTGSSAPAGNTTLFVTISDYSTKIPLEYVMVRLSDGQTKKTSAAGVASFVVLTGGTYTILAEKTGYTSVETTSTVSGSVYNVNLQTLPLRTTTAPTLAPGQMPTIDSRTNTQKQNAIADLLTNNGEGLVGFFILLTIIGGAKMMMK